MTLRRVIFLIAVVTVSGSALAQTAEPVARHAAYGEILGNALLFSANYERRFTERLAGRVGLSVLPFEDEDGDTDTVLVVPLMLNAITHPRANHHFETGIGLLIAGGERLEFTGLGDEGDETFSTAAGTATIGYRYQRPGGGFIFRVGLTPVFDSRNVLPWLGVSFGGNF